MRILVVDDDPEFLEFLSTLLTRLGHEVVCETSHENAIELQSQEKFDAAFVDQRLRGTDGADLAERLLDAYPDLPIVMMSGDIEGFMSRRNELAEKVYTLPKPFELQSLKSLIGRLSSDKN